MASELPDDIAVLRQKCLIGNSSVYNKETMWEIKLKAEPRFLEPLPKCYVNSNLQVIESDKEYFIRSNRFCKITDKEVLYEYGESLVHFLNVSYQITYQVDPEIVSNGYYSYEENGERKLIFQAIGSAFLSVKQVVFCLDKSLESKWFKIWENNENVRDVYRLLSGTVDWFCLFKVYETIRDDESFGSAKKGIEMIIKWSELSENDSFFRTANYHRHAMFSKYKGRENSSTAHNMNIEVAEIYVHKILTKWMEWKSSQ